MRFYCIAALLLSPGLAFTQQAETTRQEELLTILERIIINLEKSSGDSLVYTNTFGRDVISPIYPQKDWQSRIEIQEKRLTEIEAKLAPIEVDINNLQSRLGENSEQKASIDSIQSLKSEAEDELIIRRVANFKSFVLAWYDLGEQLEAISATAQSIVLFPESDLKLKPLLTLGQYAGLAGGLAGSAWSLKEPEQGLATIGFSLTATGLLSKLFGGRKARRTMENVSRNIEFSDNIHSFEKVAGSFSVKAGQLYLMIRKDWDEKSWYPESSHLQEFYAMISLRRDLNVIIRQMKAKAEYLKTFPLSMEGQGHLDNLIIRYERALQSWEISEVVYLNTYRSLLKLRENIGNSGN